MATKRKRARQPKPDVDDRFTMRLKPNLREALAALAEADKRPLANYVRCVLEEHVEQTKIAAAAQPIELPHAA